MRFGERTVTGKHERFTHFFGIRDQLIKKSNAKMHFSLLLIAPLVSAYTVINNPEIILSRQSLHRKASGQTKDVVVQCEKNSMSS